MKLCGPGALFACALLFTACPALASVHAGDKLNVVVFDHPDISGMLTVTNDGGLVVPLAGRVQAQGLEPQAIAREIETQLKPYIFSPAVDVTLVSESNTAYLTGVLSQALALHPAETLAMAVGETKLPASADLTNVTIHRDARTLGPFNLLAMQTSADTSPQLVSGDAVTVPAKPVMVRVSGAVKAPATVFLARDEPLGLALGSVEPADNANLQRVELVRGGKIAITSRTGAALTAPGQSGDGLVIPPWANVTVLGLAGKPGPVVLKGDQSLATALTLAGGAAKGADLGRIVVISGDGSARSEIVDYNAFTRGDTHANPDLADGDVVYVPKAAPRPSPQQLLALALIAAKKAGIDVTKLLKP